MKGYVYKLWSLEGNLIYIGSTKNTLSKRFDQHKKALDCTSKILFETYKKVKIELIELVEYTIKPELIAREGFHQRNLDCVNKNIADRTKKERYNDNKEKILEKGKIYYQNNVEKIAEEKKKYYENNKEKLLKYQKEIITCECGCEITKHCLTRHKKSAKHIDLLTAKGTPALTHDTTDMGIMSTGQ